MATAPVAHSVVEQAIATGEDYNKLRKEGVFTDLEIRTNEGTTLKAHRVVVGAPCPSLKESISMERILDFSRFPSMYVLL